MTYTREDLEKAYQAGCNWGILHNPQTPNEPHFSEVLKRIDATKLKRMMPNKVTTVKPKKITHVKGKLSRLEDPAEMLNDPIESLVSDLVKRKANLNNTIDLDAYAMGARDLLIDCQAFQRIQEKRNASNAPLRSNSELLEEIATLKYDLDEMRFDLKQTRLDEKEALKKIDSLMKEDKTEDMMLGMCGGPVNNKLMGKVEIIKEVEVSIESICDEMLYQLRGNRIEKHEQCEEQGHPDWQIGMYYLRKAINLK